MSFLFQLKQYFCMFSFQHSSHSKVDRAMSLGECDSGTGDQWVTTVLCDIFSFISTFFSLIIMMIGFSSRADAIEGIMYFIMRQLCPIYCSGK